MSTLMELLMKNLAFTAMATGVKSGNRTTDKDGKLTGSPYADELDGIAMKGGDPESDKKDFEKKVMDKIMGDDK